MAEPNATADTPSTAPPAARAGAAAREAPSPQPTIELGELLHQYQLSLVLIAGQSAQAAARPVQWVHVSELEDPTPFLPPRTVLLTTGARFAAVGGQGDADAYVRRLIDAGVTALGVAVGLHFDRVPPSIVSACDRLGLPLFRVPYDTAFIEIVQTAARLLDARTRERDLWALDAQRALATASLHRDGLGAAVREAAARLGRWVCVTDRAGRIVEFAPQAARAQLPAEWVRRETRHLVERGLSAGRIEGEGGGMQMQALGRPGRVLGVLAVEGHGTPDTAERTLIGLVAAIATVQLEHRSGIDGAQAALRQAVVRLLLARDFALAEQLADGALSRLPHGPIVVARYRLPESRDPELLTELRSLDSGSPGLLIAEHEGAQLILSETRHLPAIRRLLLARGVPAGLSERGALPHFAELLGQADRALDHARSSATPGPVDYLPALHDGVLHLLGEHPEGRQRAEGLLAPIRQHDRRHGDGIEAALRAWLAHHGQTSPAAAELGVHRHTLRARIQTAAALLQAELDSPDTRAELWAALRLAAEPAQEPEPGGHTR
ncbi:PucR family transcriptional regulator [Leucobacter massiliensis]|uniref:PucR family transcriptional regulator n=1 Tax=Leucobacter massiliensis TaxID=1686285 RepID=A0A2S9QQ37_9MICO|nr:PucR family transcriptional regulator [Leucobacter massiliensis]PRI11695.1 PucR family transcriptional regulator [Leucobacter massiliensis]